MLIVEHFSHLSFTLIRYEEIFSEKPMSVLFRYYVSFVSPSNSQVTAHHQRTSRKEPGGRRKKLWRKMLTGFLFISFLSLFLNNLGTNDLIN